MAAILAPSAGAVAIDGFVGPAHVSCVIGSAPYEPFARERGKPVVIAGFEPLDVLQAVLMLVRQVNAGRAEVENEFSRAVSREGNLKAQDRVAEAFEVAGARRALVEGIVVEALALVTWWGLRDRVLRRRP